MTNNSTGGIGGGIAGGGLGGAIGGAGIAGAAGRGGFHVPEVPEQKIVAVATLLIDADVPHKLLTDATERGLDAAKEALPGRGAVRAEGALQNLRDRKRVKVTLTIRGVGANGAWAAAAERAFAEAFLARLAKKGHAGEHVA